MGVYENIRKNTYSKPQGVYARIHANDKKEEAPKEKDVLSEQKSNAYPIKDKYNSAFAMPVKQGIGDKIANFFKMTLPTAAEKAVDNIKEPFTGASASKLMTEAKLSPQMMVEDAKIQLAKENPTREDYAMVKQTQEVIDKYGKPESNFRAISGDTTKLQEQLKSAEKTWQVSPVDATLANTGAGVANIFGSLGSFANSLGADKVPLLREVTNFAVDGARKAQENAQQYNRGDYGEALGTVTQGVVNLVPYFVLGTGKTAVKGATAVTKYAKYIEPIIKNPSFWYSLTSMWGSKYQEKLDEGYNRFQALGNSILYAVPAALIEVSGGIGAKGKEAQSLLRTMGEEIGEEIAQDIMGGISDKIATNHDLPVFSTTEDAIINPKELAKTALYTAPIVAIGGGANRVINNIANPNSQTEALPEMDVSTQNQLANITKNIEYQKQNENLANNQIEQIIKEARNNIENSKTTLALPEGNRFYADEKGNVVNAQNYVAPRRQAQNQNSPVNTKQTIIDVQNNSQDDLLRRINTTLPTQAEMAQKGNMEQINANPNLATQKAQKTYQSAKIAGMTDVDMKKAIDLNNMLRSGANLEFYDEKNIPQNVQADKAKIANGFYKDGTLWINKNSKNKVEQILGHELTHHLESTNSYTDLSNTILDSDVFYDYISEKGYTNVAEYKTKLKEMGYTDAQMNNEMVARFVEEKLFTDQNSIDRLARQNTKLVEKIKNWISDLVVSFKGTSQEKELRRIENMYRKALEQARNTTTSAETQYSVGGVIGARNIQNNPEYRNIMADYQDANAMLNNGANNYETIRKTGWFRDTDGNVKYEFTDEDMALKDSYKFDDNKVYPLDKILKHDVLFEAYPQLRDYTVLSMDIGDTHRAAIFSPLKVILLNNQKLKTREQVEYSLIHEIQHAIQNIEGFPGARTNINGKYAYYTSLGEIESRNTSDRLRMLAEERRQYIPETAKENPTHPGLENYLKNRKQEDIEKDNKYIAKKERTDALKESVRKFFEGRMGFDDFEENNISNISETTSEDNKLSSRADGRGRLAGKEPAFSINPVNIAKNPPNIETGLDQLSRAKRVKEGDSQSNFAGNILNQSIFDEKFTNLALDDKNIRSYESISNKETLQEANDAINEQGQKWVDRFLDKPNGEMKATDIAGGFILMNRYQQVGDYESMIRVAEKLRKAGTQQGQTIQMFSVLGRMTPEGMTYYAQKELSKAYDEILKNKTQKWADEHADEFKLNDKDIEYIQRRVTQAAKLPEGRDKYVLLGEIASRIQNKIPPQAGQGLKALARNSMLLNPKTMVRNILGNVVIAPNHIVSDFIGSKIDESISKKTGIRTTGGFDVKALQGAKKGIYESFDDFRRKISTREMGGDRFEIGQGKNFYENHTGRFGETRNKINKALNGLDRVTGFLLEAGDRPFYETWFINSLNNQMKLNNVTEPTAEMIEIATDEALQRTWQDSNAYTGFVTNFRKGLNKLNIKGYGLGDIVMPFVKTPANLTKAVVDFSPLGAINAAVKTSQFNKDIGKGVATTKQQREVVKAWSQVITGTIGMAIMTAMANAGILGGGSDEDKDVRNFEQKILGIKPYSIKIGDNTYTYDWAQPLGTSAAMVADTVKSLKNAKDTEGKVAAALEGLQSGASVLLEQSFVSGIRQFFEEDGLISALIEAVFYEPTKFTPQFLSQLAQLQDDTERVSYVYNNIPQTAKNKIKAKIPGLRETLEPNIDVLGREVKTDNSIGNVMFNPANTATASTTEAAEEMYRVYKATGEKSAIAQVAPYYFDVGNEKIVLTPKQKTQYQKTIGKIASDGVENLIDNKAYKNLSDADKAEILKELYSYGNAVAKEEASAKYLMPKDMQKIKDSGMNPEEYILLKRIANSGGTKKEELYNALTSAGYNNKKTEQFLSYYKGYNFDNSKNTLPTLKQQRAKLLSLKNTLK